jgi:surface antigen
MSRSAPCLRKRVLAAVASMFATLCVTSAMAATLGPFDLAWPGLTQDDLDRMHAAAARLYEGQSIGTVERWRSPQSQDAGEVKLIRTFSAYGMPCSELDYVIRFQTERDNPDHYVVNWCKLQNGEWKIVQIPSPH